MTTWRERLTARMVALRSMSPTTPDLADVPVKWAAAITLIVRQ